MADCLPCMRATVRQSIVSSGHSMWKFALFRCSNRLCRIAVSSPTNDLSARTTTFSTFVGY